MKKYRVLRDIFICKEGDVIESDNTCGMFKNLNYQQCVDEGLFEEVKQGFNEEVEEILNYEYGYDDFFAVLKIVKAHKEDRKKWALEMVKDRLISLHPDNPCVDILQELIKAIKES